VESQVFYAEPHRIAGTNLPKPATPPHFITGAHPSIRASVDTFTTAEMPSKAMSLFAGIELNHRKAVLHLPSEGSIKERYAAAPDLLRRSVEITPHPNALFINLAPEKGSVWELKTPK
jgi:hypothetical protein